MRAILVPIVLALSVALPAPGQAGAADATLQKGQSLVSAGDFAGAAKVLGEVCEREPGNAQAWFLLGYARHASKDIDGAIEAHVKAAEFPATRPMASYNAACAFALKGDADKAFEWLDAARKAGFQGWGQLANDSDLTSLHGDPRFASYLPGRPRGASVFREDVKVVHEWVGEAPGDVFGWIAQNAGDADGDGVNDVCTSAPYRKSSKGVNAGKVYTYSGKTGELLWSVEGQPGEVLGIGIQGAGDVNADGHGDVVAGATRQGNGPGKVYVYSGKDGAVLHELSAGQPGDQFGRKVAKAGDWNGDGYADVVVGAPGAKVGGQATGRAYVYSGKDGAVLLEIDGEAPGEQFGGCVAGTGTGDARALAIGAQDAGANKGGVVRVFRPAEGGFDLAFTIPSGPEDVNLGRMFISFVGDVDADGVADVYASDWESNVGYPGAGRAYVHSGKTGERLFDLKGERQGDGFGIGTADAGDVDGDGHDDLLIGAWQNDDGAPGGGKTYLISGADGRRIATWTCTAPGDTFGFDATGLGDVDGDGRIDLLITSGYSNVAGAKSGRVFVVAGPPRAVGK